MLLRHRPLVRLGLGLALVVTPLVEVAGASAARASGNTTYTPGTPVLDTVANGPWTLSQGDPGAGAPYDESLAHLHARRDAHPGGGFPQPGGVSRLRLAFRHPLRQRGGGHAGAGARLLHRRRGRPRDRHPGRRAGRHRPAHVAVLLPLRHPDARATPPPGT